MTKALSFSLSTRICGLLPFLLFSFLLVGCGRVPCQTTVQCKSKLGSDYVCARRQCVSTVETDPGEESGLVIGDDDPDQTSEEEETNEEESSEGSSGDDKSKN